MTFQTVEPSTARGHAGPSRVSRALSRAIAARLAVIEARLGHLEANLAELTDHTLALALDIHAALDHHQEPTSA